jgi:DNA polymerase III delta prime subunit
MIPLLIISKDSKLINDYVNKLKIGNLYFEIVPSTKEYSIEDIKNLKKETKIYNPKVRFYFLENFHLSSIPAQNSFLKLLEEPPANVQFVLSTDNKNRLLPTIISRVKIIKLQTNEKQTVGAQFIAPMIEGLNLVKFKITDKESAKDIFLQMLFFFRQRLADDVHAPSILKEILKNQALLENNNLNPQLTIDQVLIFIYKQYNMN